MNRISPAVLMAAFVVLAVVPSVSAQAETETVTLWAHGEAREAMIPEVSSEDVIWMNTAKADPRATDTANGPGYCPTVPPTTLNLPVVGDPACLPENQARQATTIDYTWALKLDPALDATYELTTGGSATFSVSFGSSSGSCKGEYTASLASGDTVIVETEATPFEYSSGYQAFPATATVQGASIGPDDDLTWTIHATCDGDGLFLGINAETSMTSLTLPLGAPEPEVPEAPTPPEPETPEGNGTAEAPDNGTAEEPPEPTETQAPEPTPAETPEPTPTAEAAEVQSVEESSGIPALGLPVLVAALGAALWVARRRL